MIRVCDGTDPNLLRDDPPWDPSSIEPREAHTTRPCDCGLRFDDVDRWVIYPHPLVGGGRRRILITGTAG